MIDRYEVKLKKVVSLLKLYRMGMDLFQKPSAVNDNEGYKQSS